jgi:hypothetical protein
LSRLPVYADENVSRRLVEALRARGFDVLTALDAGTLGQGDQSQLEFAASVHRVLLTFDRRDFRRIHQEFTERGFKHAGIALLPQTGDTARTAVRAAMLLDWMATSGPPEGRVVNWNDLQLSLHGGHRVPGFKEEDVRLALGL